MPVHLFICRRVSTMNPYVLSCSSTVDLDAGHLEKRNISYVRFHFYVDGVHHYDDMGQSMSSHDFFDSMRKGAMTKTSQVNVSEFAEYFEKFLQEGKDVVHVSLSSGLSGSCQSAKIAAQELAEKYPECKVYVVDSLAASSGYGLLIDTLADLRDEGMSAEMLYHWAEENKLRVHHWFFSTDLQYYLRGGRVSRGSYVIGTILGICPLLHMDAAGKLIPVAKIRTKKRVIEELVHRMEENADNGTDYAGRCYICHSDCMEDARAAEALVEERFPNLKGKIRIFNIGTVIGSHSGPGTVALFFFGKPRDAEA